MSKSITFLINQSEITAGTRGASLGPDAIVTAARKNGSLIFGAHEVKRLPNVNHLLDRPTSFPFAKRIDGVLDIYESLNTSVSAILKSNNFPFLLSGDHGSAGGTIAGIRSAFPSKKLGILWIDAHADIHTPYTTPSGNVHGMPLATALAVDNTECAKNQPDDNTISYWNQLKNVGAISPKINPEDIIYVAVRDVEVEEIEILNRLAIRQIRVEEVREKGIAHTLSVINEHLNHCDIIYVSFDVDSMDPDLTSYGTGTPVKNGLTPQEAKQLVVAMAANPKTVCLEVVEVNPCLDEKINKMAEIALDVIEAAVETLKK
jgi:arginase